MTETDQLHSAPSDCDRFLFAPVGEDKNGYVVTVLSTFARLGLDPRTEASNLAALSRPAARERLDRLLIGFLDVPALRQGHGSTAKRLASLLPERMRTGTNLRDDGAQGGVRTKLELPVFWLLMILLALVQILYFGLSGAGE
ncbi:hypothetical protein FHS00_001589 [Limimaricola variabilis]|uniref:Type IV / VI secretion system DotU domain-containing protein n=1 Tax=Limimaricola variabilis TaxID=1492771 RepID=A0ABR6HNI1_9RHOB|nr:hypothetical protein [Limimaricola variabilis]MBB3712013.1 hypothetical protein [Limimaricola variabilis]